MTSSDITRGRKLLILGASGQVGGRLMAEAARRYGDDRVVGTYNMQPAEGLVPADLENPEAVRQLVLEHEPWAIVIAAAFAWVDGCESEPERSWLINVEGPRAVAVAAAEVGAVPLLISTDYVFDGEAGPYAEEAPVHPINAYGQHKLDAESAMQSACDQSLIVRTNVVYSWHPGGKNFLMQVVGNLSQGKKMRVPRDQWNTPTYAPDLASGLLELLERQATGVFHFGGADFVQRHEFGLRIARAFGLDEALLEPIATSELAQEAKRPLRSGLLAKRFEALAGRPTVGIAAALADARTGTVT